jgi:predicted FMN-binding regulatory protein PaiB
MRVVSLQSKFKISQNRSQADRAGLMRGFASRTDDGSHGILELMRAAESE